MNKYKYLVKKHNGHCFSQIFTLWEIENGEALMWLKANQVGEDELHRLKETTLPDKNGTEIYEGDILRQHKTKGTILFVRWDKDAKWVAEEIGFLDTWEELWRWATVTEVIGNIHDNPELLEKKE